MTPKIKVFIDGINSCNQKAMLLRALLCDALEEYEANGEDSIELRGIQKEIVRATISWLNNIDDLNRSVDKISVDF